MSLLSYVTVHSTTVGLGRSTFPGSPVDPEVLVCVAQACRNLERLRFRYVDSKGNSSERHVEPFQLVRYELGQTTWGGWLVSWQDSIASSRCWSPTSSRLRWPRLAGTS